MAAGLGLKVLAQLPMDPALAQAMDQGGIERLEKNYLDGVAEVLS